MVMGVAHMAAHSLIRALLRDTCLSQENTCL
jgi:hypothetical protein